MRRCCFVVVVNGAARLVDEPDIDKYTDDASEDIDAII